MKSAAQRPDLLDELVAMAPDDAVVPVRATEVDLSALPPLAVLAERLRWNIDPDPEVRAVAELLWSEGRGTWLQICRRLACSELVKHRKRWKEDPRWPLTWERLLEDVAIMARGVELWNRHPLALPDEQCDMFAAPWLESLEDEQVQEIVGEALETFDWKSFSADACRGGFGYELGRDERAAIRASCLKWHGVWKRPVLYMAQVDRLIEERREVRAC